MDTLRRSLLMTPLALAATGAAAQTAAPVVPNDTRQLTWPEPVGTIDLWPNDRFPGDIKAPANLKEVVEEVSTNPADHLRRVQGISRPRLAVFPAAKPNGGAMLIIPGGGFSWNYFDHEGYELAAKLNAQGVTCFVLFYRLSNDGWADRADVGTIDALRAMRVIRANAARFKLDAARVGVAGFSAGGFLTASVATRHTSYVYPKVDATDSLSARPFLAAPIYPVQSLDPAIAYSGTAPSLFGGPATPEQIARYTPDRNVDADTPPVFLVHAEDDKTVPVENSTALRDALKAKGRVVETHLFATGGHGFGMKPGNGEPWGLWSDLLVAFIRRQGLMG